MGTIQETKKLHYGLMSINFDTSVVDNEHSQPYVKIACNDGYIKIYSKGSLYECIPENQSIAMIFNHSKPSELVKFLNDRGCHRINAHIKG